MAITDQTAAGLADGGLAAVASRNPAVGLAVGVIRAQVTAGGDDR